MTIADRAIFAAYCVFYSRWIRAEEEIVAYVAQHGTDTYRTRGGAWKQIPQLLTARQAYDDMRKAAGEIGMTPSARTRVQAVKGETKSVLDTMIAEGAPKPWDGNDHPN